ncbi:MAG: DUF1707 domain-containing protein [Micromonosporaceae bacterium]|nr:DUF1707 domain-containing protein [Micromonosporaceae bacterium]
MTSELAPRDHRISDAERGRAVEQLRGAIGVGRLTLEEFEQRIGSIYRAHTRADLEPLVADVVPSYARDVAELRVNSGSVKRVGRWAPPRRLVVNVGSGSVKLDLTQALLAHPELEVDLTLRSGSVKIVLPPGATADVDDVDDVEVRSGEVKSRAPSIPEPASFHVRVAGSVRSGSVKLRYQRRFWRWRW